MTTVLAPLMLTKGGGAGGSDAMGERRHGGGHVQVVYTYPGQASPVSETKTRPALCLEIAKKSFKCLEESGGNRIACRTLFDSYMVCQKQKAHMVTVCAPSK